MLMIPHHIAFTYTSLPNSIDKPFSLIHYLAIKSAAMVNGCPVACHFEHAPDSPYWIKAQRYMTPVHMAVPRAIAGIPLCHPAHCSDVMRLQILKDHGGIYLDLDVICVTSFRDLLGH